MSAQFLSNRFVAVIASSALTLIILMPMAITQIDAQENALTVQTDRTSYETGDMITVTGTVGTIVAGHPVLLLVLDPQGNLDHVAQTVEVPPDGSFSYSFRAGGLMNTDGVYRVMVTYAGVSEQTTFEFDALDIWSTWLLEIAGQTYEIRYMITGGSVEDMIAHPDFQTLSVIVASASDGVFTIELPTHVMDSEDTDFSVFIDDDHGNFIVDELEPTGQGRVISVEFPAGAEEIEIIGTYMVPEFGVLAAAIMAIAIVGTIVATLKYQKFRSLLP